MEIASVIQLFVRGVYLFIRMACIMIIANNSNNINGRYIYIYIYIIGNNRTDIHNCNTIYNNNTKYDNIIMLSLCVVYRMFRQACSPPCLPLIINVFKFSVLWDF